jgi:hypothetical protein
MAKEVRLRKRLHYTPPNSGSLPSKNDGEPIRITTAQQLALLMGGRWFEGCDHGSARCPACGKPGLLIFQCEGGIRISCREECPPVAIYWALRALGLAVAEFLL